MKFLNHFNLEKIKINYFEILFLKKLNVLNFNYGKMLLKEYLYCLEKYYRIYK